MFRIRVKNGIHFEGKNKYGQWDIFVSKFPLHKNSPDKFELVSEESQDEEVVVPDIEDIKAPVEGFEDRFYLIYKEGDTKTRILDSERNVYIGKNKKYLFADVLEAIKQYKG